MALCYNFTRVLNILGFEPFVVYMAAKTLQFREYALAAAPSCIQLVLSGFYVASYLAVRRLGLAPTR
jgi:hypothetical protein